MAVTAGSAGSASAVKATPNAQMYLSVAMAMVGAMMFGLDQGNFGNVQSFKSFRAEWCVGRFGNSSACSKEHIEENTAWEHSFVMWGATLITIGAAVGALVFAPCVARKHGRRPCVAVGGGICLVGCLMASYLSLHNITVFYIGRFVTGFGVGVSCFALPVYNAEISTPSIRGATGSLFQLNVVIGGFFACVVTLLDAHWRLGMVLPGIAGCILMCTMPLLPESPRFVMETKGYDAGVGELRKVRSGDVTEEAQSIWEDIKKQAQVEQVSYQELVFGDGNRRKRLFIACMLVLGQQATGVNAFLGYASTIFKTCGIDDPLSFNVIFNGVMFFGCLTGLALVDSRYGGRRCQLLVATSIMGPPLVLAAFALSFILEQPPAASMVTTAMPDPHQGWMQLAHIATMVCLITYGVGFQFAWGTIPWIYPSEIFSMKEKGKAVSLAVCLNYVGNAVVVIITPSLMTASTPATLAFFGVLNCLNFVFVWLFVKETKGVPLEDVPALFEVDGEKDPRTSLRESLLS